MAAGCYRAGSDLAGFHRDLSFSLDDFRCNRAWATPTIRPARLRASVHVSCSYMDEPTPDTQPRELVDRDRLRTDISPALQVTEATQTARENLSRAAFQAVAALIVDYFERRGYVVTAPNT